MSGFIGDIGENVFQTPQADAVNENVNNAINVNSGPVNFKGDQLTNIVGLVAPLVVIGIIAALLVKK